MVARQVRVQVRIPWWMVEVIQDTANAQGRTVSNQVRHMLHGHPLCIEADPDTKKNREHPLAVPAAEPKPRKPRKRRK